MALSVDQQAPEAYQDESPFKTLGTLQLACDGARAAAGEVGSGQRESAKGMNDTRQREISRV